MAFHLENHEPPLDGLVRLFEEEVQGVARELGGFSRNPTRAIHEARKHGKRARAVLRLLRNSLPEMSRRENAALRDIGRALAPFRDRDAQRESFLRLTRTSQRRGPVAIRKELTKRSAPPVSSDVLAPMRSAEEILMRVREVELPNDAGFSVMEAGLVSAYRKARQAMTGALLSDSARDFHEWRKRTKDLCYQFLLLRKLWPKILKAFHAELDDLGELLGENQDLTVLEEAAEKLSITEGDLKSFRALVKKRREHLHKRCHDLGRLLFAEKPKALARRLRGYWKAARGD